MAAGEMIASGSDPRDTELPQATLAYAQASVRRGVPFPVLIRSYRLGHQAVSDVLFERIAELAPDAETWRAATRLCSAWVFGFVDAARHGRRNRSTTPSRSAGFGAQRHRGPRRSSRSSRDASEIRTWRRSDSATESTGSTWRRSPGSTRRGRDRTPYRRSRRP